MKNLLDKIEDINKDIDNINESIDDLLVEQASILRPFGQWLLRSWIKGKVFSDDEEKNDKEVEKKYDDFLKSDEKEKEIDDVVDQVKELSDDTDPKAVEEFREMLNKIADKQKELLQDLINKKGFEKITVEFNKPIEFTLKRGDNSGKELKLEKTKTYDVFMVEKNGRKTKIYFNYKTRGSNWLRKYGILFAIEIKNAKPGQQYDRVTVSLIYVNENLIRNNEIKIVDDKVLTHRGMVEIKNIV